MVDTVTRKEDKLYMQWTGNEAFCFPVKLDHSTFTRDKEGRVLELHSYSADDDQGFHEKKTK